MTTSRERYDAVVVGAGPNGLAAAIELARGRRSVLLLEAQDTVGGGSRSAELTLPGFIHDICSEIHPLALASPFFRSLDLDRLGIELVHPEHTLAHPLEGEEFVIQRRSIAETSESLGRDGDAYARLMNPLAEHAEDIIEQVLGPLRPPRHPLTMARFGLMAIRSARALARRFESHRAPALVAGIAAHSMLPLNSSPTAGVALFLGLLAHAVGWPAVKGGSQRIADGLRAELEALGGEVRTRERVTSLDSLPPARAYVFDLTPRQLLEIAGDRLQGGYRRRLAKFRYGPGVFKADWALNEPIPWKDGRAAGAGTVHLGGTFGEIAYSEAEVTAGRHPERPYVLLAQPSSPDPSRAPAGKHTAWAYCHVPSGSEVDMTDRIEAQIERFAPGFRDVVAARSTMNTRALEAHNENYIGGDINGGLQDLPQLFTRPSWRINPYTTPADEIFICSSSTPPGGGVHGMCGYWAARAALRSVLK